MVAHAQVIVVFIKSERANRLIDRWNFIYLFFFLFFIFYGNHPWEYIATDYRIAEKLCSRPRGDNCRGAVLTYRRGYAPNSDYPTRYTYVMRVQCSFVR